MWNKKRSLALSKFAVVLFMVALAAALIGAPWLVGWVLRISPHATESDTTFFLITLYSGGIPAAYLLVLLYRLLQNIGKGQVFTASNVSCLRRISWSCIAGAVICLVSALYFLPWLIVAIAAAFVGLIVRVVKNVMAEAVQIKEENDFTI